MTRIEELQMQLSGCWQEIGMFRDRERACYDALGYDPGASDKAALPYLINQLKAERDAAQAEVRFLRTRPDLSEEEVAQMNIGYLVIEKHQLEHDLEQVKNQLDRANAACAEMRAALLVVDDWDDKPGTPTTAKMLVTVRRALSTSCGTGYLPPEVGKMLVELLEEIWDEDEMGWILDDPEGGSSHQECVKCGAVLPHGGHAEDCLQGKIQRALDAAKKAGLE